MKLSVIVTFLLLAIAEAKCVKKKDLAKMGKGGTPAKDPTQVPLPESGETQSKKEKPSVKDPTQVPLPDSAEKTPKDKAQSPAAAKTVPAAPAKDPTQIPLPDSAEKTPKDSPSAPAAPATPPATPGAPAVPSPPKTPAAPATPKDPTQIPLPKSAETAAQHDIPFDTQAPAPITTNHSFKRRSISKKRPENPTTTSEPTELNAQIPRPALPAQTTTPMTARPLEPPPLASRQPSDSTGGHEM